MLITAIAQGYKEIYLTGIDFYENGGLSYAFDMQNKINLFQSVPGFNSNASNQSHQHKFDKQILKIIQHIDGVKIFSISESSPMVNFFPLAPEKKLVLNCV